MKREVVITGDGSATIRLPEWNEQYHSKHGAMAEAYHVFIKQGFHNCTQKNLAILEVGFGTGLNALITLIESQDSKRQISYTGVEKYPVTMTEVKALNYIEALNKPKFANVFKAMHLGAWGEPLRILPHFQLEKQKKDFYKIQDSNAYELIYFDAFGARVQPELWTETIFKKMYEALKSKGVLVTYAAKGSVRRNMQAAGFTVERLPGPPGKREMLRATKGE